VTGPLGTGMMVSPTCTATLSHMHMGFSVHNSTLFDFKLCIMFFLSSFCNTSTTTGQDAAD
jgi:hypothetical protein